MKYLVHAHSKQSATQQLYGMLQGQARQVTVYVVGVEDDVALAALLADGAIDPVRLAPHVKFVETIGVPDGKVNEAQLVRLAEQRVKQLEAKHASI